MGTPAYRLSTKTVAQLNDERHHQVVDKGYTKEADDELPIHQWVDILQTYVNKLNFDAEGPEEFQEILIKIAAVACAGKEALDRAVH